MRSTTAIFVGIVAASSVVWMPGEALATTPTVTKLTVSPASPVTAGKVVTLSAAVTATGNPVTRGTVVFCDAAAMHCLDAAVLGQALLTNGGSAATKLRLGIGTHGIKAVFQGTAALAASTSTPASLTVSGSATSETTTIVSLSRGPGAYTLTGTVGTLNQIAPTGTISFVDASRGNASLGSASLNAATASPGLFPRSRVSFLTEASSSIAGDFNGDGILDLAIVSSAFREAHILLGLGDGTFNPVEPPIALGAQGILAVGDLNGDGILDFGISDSSSNSVKVFLGNGDGTFRAHSTISVKQPFAIAVADFDRDGILDIAVGGLNADGTLPAVTVLKGAGDGGFSVVSTTNLDTYASSMAVADFNGDGFLDLVTGGFHTATILLGNGDGTLTVKSTPTVATDQATVVSGDFNGDGIPDLAVANVAEVGDGTVSVLLGKGDGTFTPEFSEAVPNSPSIATGDFNGDGVTDLVAASYGTTSCSTPGCTPPPQVGVITLLTGHGDGTFTTHVESGPVTGYFPTSATVADFNGDGISDLASASPPGIGYLDAFLGGIVSTASAVNPLENGSYQVVAEYSGDANHAPSKSQPLSFNPTGTPAFLPQPGIYGWTQTILISDGTPGATIYYTLDGTTPTTSSTRYLGAITVTWEATIKAFAVSPGNADSAVATANYSIERPMEPPTFKPPSGTYAAGQSISLTVNPSYCSHAVCVIYYTLDGSTPTAGSRKYTAPIVLSTPGTVTIKAIATSHHFMPSPVASAGYTIH